MDRNTKYRFGICIFLVYQIFGYRLTSLIRSLNRSKTKESPRKVVPSSSRARAKSRSEPRTQRRAKLSANNFGLRLFFITRSPSRSNATSYFYFYLKHWSNKTLRLLLKILLWVDFKTFFKIVHFSLFFLVVSLTCTDIPCRFLSIPKLVRTLFLVSVVVATPMIFTALKYVLRQLKL